MHLNEKNRWYGDPIYEKRTLNIGNFRLLHVQAVNYTSIFLDHFSGISLEKVFFFSQKIKIETFFKEK